MKNFIKNAISILFTMSMASPLARASYSSVSGDDLLKHEKVTVDVKGKKGLVVVFLSAKCPCSNSHVEELRDLVKVFPEFSFVGVHSNIDEAEEITRPYFEKLGLPFSIIQDSQTEIANRFNALKTPHAFVILADDRIAYQGGVSDSKQFNRADRKYLREALTDLQAGLKVRTPEGRTLGCSIERGEKHVW